MTPDHGCRLAGGILWFCIPFTLATCLGLASRALDLPLTAAEAGEGLVPPAAATYLLGKGGAILIVLMLFMAVTSSGANFLLCAPCFSFAPCPPPPAKSPHALSSSFTCRPLLARCLFIALRHAFTCTEHK